VISALTGRTRTAALATACAVVVGFAATACGPHPAASIAIRSTALNLQFARPDLAKPIPPKILIKLLPLPPAAAVPTVGGGVPSIPPIVVVPPPTNGCPPSSRRGKTAARLKESTLGSPAAGFYGYDTKGSATVSGGAQKVTVPVPGLTRVAISKPTKATPDTTVAAEGGAPASGFETEYTVTTRLSDSVSQVDELTVSATSINLMQRTLSDGERTMTFTPTPQVQLVKFGAVGSSWKSSGSDNSSGSVLDYQGSITGTRQIDVCGQLVAGYVVSYSSSLANPAEGEIIRTNSDDANTMLVAPQLGGLVVRQHVDTDDIRFNASLSGYLDVMLNYDSTIRRLTPTTTAAAL
jgi:hypothetical protein